MKLLRVQVPNFRALKNVDISFEPDFTPQVFPLGSLNGGGKSTLLQLIFVLLSRIWLNSGKHIPTDNFLSNMLSELILVNENNEVTKLATIDLLENNEKITFSYFYGSLNQVKKIFNTLNSTHCTTFMECGNRVIFIAINVHGKEGTHQHEHLAVNIVNNCKRKIFLVSPANQNYLFLSRKERRLLFTSDNENSYDKVLKGLKEILPNFFTYDFIDVLTEIFRLARDKDYRERNKDNPFAHSEKLETDINNLFNNSKKIMPITVEQERHTKDSIQSIGFKLPSGEKIYPEDLSHGELKRLTIFVLLKYHEIQDSIVLFDEIENGFHPDWQYEIVRDLVKWGKDNQYILATHSYELCTALTPAHVKELEPQLIKNA